MSYLVKAINNLKPGAEFSFTEDDYSTIKWDVLNGQAPTQAEITTEIERIKAKEIQTAKDVTVAKAALLTKLGITADEAALLLA